jgi:hypothetical protein
VKSLDERLDAAILERLGYTLEYTPDPFRAAASVEFLKRELVEKLASLLSESDMKNAAGLYRNEFDD